MNVSNNIFICYFPILFFSFFSPLFTTFEYQRFLHVPCSVIYSAVENKNRRKRKICRNARRNQEAWRDVKRSRSLELLNVLLFLLTDILQDFLFHSHDSDKKKKFFFPPTLSKSIFFIHSPFFTFPSDLHKIFIFSRMRGRGGHF